MTWLLGLIVVTGVPLVVYYFVTRKRPDLVFALSDPISVPSADADDERLVQQLEVKNVGNEAAREITAKLMGGVSSEKVVPFSYADDYKTFPSPKEFELRYPELPPGGSFKLVFESSLLGVREEQVRLSHSSGPGRNGLSAPRGDLWTMVTCVSVVTFAIVLFCFLFRSQVASSLSYSVIYDSKKLLMKGKPWYLTTDEWWEIQDEAGRKFLDNDARYADTFSELPSYWLLDQDPFPTLTKLQWNELIGIAADRLPRDATYMSRSLFGSRKGSHLAAFMRTKRPKHAPTHVWDDVLMELGERYVEVERRAIRTAGPCAHPDERVHPPALSQEQQDELAEYARKLCISGAVENLPEVTDRREYLNSLDLQLLDDRQVRRLRALADAFDRTDRYSANFPLLDAILGRQALPGERPRDVTAPDWEKLVEIDARTRASAEQNEVTKLALARDKNEVHALRERVLRQLEVLDDVLTDPSAIDEIEEYDNPFSPGNFRNVRLLARILQDEAATQRDSE